MTDDRPRCGEPCSSAGNRGEPCQFPVAAEGLRCPRHQRNDVPVLEEAPER